MTYYSDTVMTPLQSALLFCDRIGMDMEFVYTDSRIIDDMLQRINAATALADDWDWDMARVNYMFERTPSVPSLWPMFRFQIGLG